VGPRAEGLPLPLLWALGWFSGVTRMEVTPPPVHAACFPPPFWLVGWGSFSGTAEWQPLGLLLGGAPYCLRSLSSPASQWVAGGAGSPQSGGVTVRAGLLSYPGVGAPRTLWGGGPLPGGGRVGGYDT